MSLFDLFSKIVEPGRILVNEPMSRHTTFAIGGPADLLILPGNERRVMDVLGLCAQERVPCLVMGKGSNLLVSDGGVEGVVLKLAEGFDSVSMTEEGMIEAEPGASLAAAAEAALARGLSGLEFASGIPGSVGGAVFMNAGAYGGEMKGVVARVRLAGRDGSVTTASNADMTFGYRTSAAQQNGAVILKVWLALAEGDPAEIKANMDELNARRAEKQPLDMPSAGSAFKRPDGHYAAKLIMDSGLRGFAVGGAQVSEKHCGFIVNKGGATAKDVLELIERVKETVYNRFGVALEEEIRPVGRG